jgi:hypothetical protein
MAGCRDRLGLRQSVRLCAAPDGTGPAVLGAWRPRIVLPQAILEDFGCDQFEAILLHELAHIRRRDVVIHWLMIAARVLHWFNPIAWLALSRMAAERELACDDVVIDVLGASSRRLYGETMLCLLERRLVRPAIPGVVHFFGSRRRLRTRLASLTRSRNRERGLKLVRIALLLGLAVFGLSDSLRSKATARSRDPIEATQSASDDARLGAKPAEDPAEVRLQGRVLDHRGAPVPGADVLLLGDEKLIAYVRLYHAAPLVQVGLADGPGHRPASVKTDEQGRFTVRRSGSALNRVAVVSDRVWLTVVPLERIPDRADAAIRLPEPGSLRIRCDISRKPAKQEFQVILRTFDGVDWEPDRVHMSDIEVPNPGRAVIGALPPAQYIVERLNHTDHGSWGVLLAFCGRTLVPVASGRTSDVAFHRKVGRPVEGRVRGLEDVDLRFAEVTIGYWGPEEAPSPLGGRQRIRTHLDVIPIGPDGRFVTPPLPPGHYYLDLFALRATTPREERQSPDFQGAAEFDLPPGGEVPPVEIVAKPPRPAARPAVPQVRNRAAENARDLEDKLLQVIRKEHEFNNPRCPFVIKARDIQDRTLIDASFKHRVSGKDEFDMVMQAKRAELHIDGRANLLRVHFEDAEIQYYGRDAGIILINDRILEIPLPPDIGIDVGK